MQKKNTENKNSQIAILKGKSIKTKMRTKAPKQKLATVISDERIIGKIFYIRGKKVMFDRDLATLYGVRTMVLNQAVKRNRDRFPEDFMFQLNKEEANVFLRHQIGTLNNENLKSRVVISKNNKLSRSQTVILNRGQNIKYLPYVFTEQGVAMLSAVLRSKRSSSGQYSNCAYLC